MEHATRHPKLKSELPLQKNIQQLAARTFKAQGMQSLLMTVLLFRGQSCQQALKADLVKKTEYVVSVNETRHETGWWPRRGLEKAVRELGEGDLVHGLDLPDVSLPATARGDSRWHSEVDELQDLQLLSRRSHLIWR